MISLLLFGVLVFYVVRFFVNFRKLQSKLPPGPTPLPLLGNLLMLRGIENNTHDELNELSKTYGPIMTFWFGYRPSIVISSVEALRDAFVTNPQQFADRPQSATADLFLRGKRDIIFAKYGTLWHEQKKLAGQAIRRIIDHEQLEDNVNATIAEVVAELTKLRGQPLNIVPYTTNIIYNVLASFCFGTRYSLTNDTYTKLLGLSETANNLQTEMMMIEFLPRWAFLDTLVRRFYRPAVKMMEVMDEYDAYIIKQYREHKSKCNYRTGEITDIMDAILAEQESIKQAGGESYADSEVIGIIQDVFMAGWQTSSDTLTWFFLFMILHPEVQAKCYQEISEVLGATPPRLADRAKLPYVEACLLETLRRRPIAPLGVPHSPVQETTFAGYFIPADSIFFINMVAMHNDPKVWKNPNNFDPRNFIDDETGQVVKPQGFVPFGAGRRVCLGETLARNDMFLVVTGLLQQLEFKRVAGEEYTIKANPKAELSNRALPFKLVVEARG